MELTYNNIGLIYGKLNLFEKSKEFKNKSDQIKLETKKNEENLNTCTICSYILEIKPNTTTKCGHTFHKDCLEQWNKPCPLCREIIE